MTDPQATLQPDAPRRSRVPARVFGAVLLLVVLWLAWRWWLGLSQVSTDNAQIDGFVTPIGARVGGYVLEVPVHDNQRVEAHSVLVKLDSRDYQARALQAEAEVQAALAAAGRQTRVSQAAAQVRSAEASAASADAQVQQAQAVLNKAEQDLSRTRRLAEQGMATRAQLDATQSAVLAARAQLAATRGQARAATDQISVFSAAERVAGAKLDAVQAQAALARHQLSDTTVRAPFAGVVSKRTVNVGQMVQAGQPLLSLVATDDLWVTANLKETDVRKIRPGLLAEVELDTYPGQKLQAEVESVSPATGARYALLPPDNASGNFTKVVQRVPVRLRLKAVPDGIILRPGLSAQVVIRLP